MTQCSECGKRLKPIAVIAGERFYYECDSCGDYVCPNCCDIDDEGIVECFCCIETRTRRRVRDEETMASVTPDIP